MDKILEETAENKIISNRIFTEKFLFQNKYNINKTPTFYLSDLNNLNLKLNPDDVISKLKTLTSKK